MKYTIAIALSATLLTGCALGTKPLEVRPVNVPAAQYEAMTCHELSLASQSAIEDKKHWAEKQQELRNGNVTMAILVAGFGTGDGPQTKKLAQAKGRVQTLTATMNKKGCK